jgi:colicin import membrane protein
MPLLFETRGTEGGLVGLSRMIALSLAIHLLFLSILFLSPSLPARKWTFGPVYTVDLVSLPSSYLEKKSSTPLSREVATLKAGRHSTVLKKSADFSIAPIKRLAPVKKETSGEVEKAIEGVRKKVETAAARQVKAPREGVVETNPVMNAYYAELWARIRSEWALPKGILPSESLEAVVDITVSRSGAVTSLNIEKRSGNRYFDQSAVRAVRKASPFPPVPAGIRGSSIDLGIRFHSEQFR